MWAWTVWLDWASVPSIVASLAVGEDGVVAVGDPCGGRFADHALHNPAHLAVLVPAVRVGASWVSRWGCLYTKYFVS